MESPLSLIFYIIVALSLWRMAKRRNIDYAWMAWIPLLDLIVLVKLANKNWWWIFLLLIPIVNIVVFVMLMMAICERFGTSKWVGLLSLIPFTLLFILPYLAFATTDGAPTAAVSTTAAPLQPTRPLPPIYPPPPTPKQPSGTASAPPENPPAAPPSEPPAQA